MILISGGTGYVGGLVVRRLAAEGHRLRLVGRTAGRASLPRGADWRTADLAGEGALDDALADAETVVHLAAALPSEQLSPADVERVNVHGTRRLAEAAARAGVARFVHVSSAGAYGDSASPEPWCEDDEPAPRTPYERSKLLGERALREALAGSSTAWTILRPTGVFGAGRAATDALFRDVARRRLWVHGPSRVIVHPLYGPDLAAAIVRTVTDGDLAGEVINLGGDRAVEYRELLTLIGAHVGRRPFHVAAPAWLAAAVRGALRTGLAGPTPPARLTRLATPLVNRAVSTEKARRLLDFRPTPLERAVAETAAELRALDPR